MTFVYEARICDYSDFGNVKLCRFYDTWEKAYGAALEHLEAFQAIDPENAKSYDMAIVEHEVH